MSTAGFMLSIIALFGSLVGCVPLLGMINWVSVPIGIIGLIFSSVGLQQNEPKTRSESIAGIVLGTMAVVFGIIRLKLGCGII